MSGPKTKTNSEKKTSRTSADEQQSNPESACCENIREGAYYKWEAAGCPGGDGVEFWLQAEAELITEAQPEDEANET